MTISDSFENYSYEGGTTPALVISLEEVKSKFVIDAAHEVACGPLEFNIIDCTINP